MFRSLALSLAVLVACAATSRADVFIGTGAVQNGAGGFNVGVPAVAGDGLPNGVNQLIGNTTLGVQYINNISSNTFNGNPAVTTTVHTVGSNLIATEGFRAGGGQAASFNGQDIVVVFAARGTTPGGSAAVFNATNIGAAFYAVPTGTYNQNNPATWGTGGAPIATYGNIFSDRVRDNGPAALNGGGPGFANLFANQVNQIGINATVGTSNQGFFMLQEINNQNFWNLIGNPLLLPNNNPNALVTRVDESLVVGDAINTGNLAANLATLNNIFNTLLPGVAALDGGVAFATAIGALGDSGGAAGAFNPSNGNPAPNTADLVFTFGTTTVLGNVFATNPPIPEPATLAVFATMMGVGGLVYRRRKAKIAA